LAQRAAVLLRFLGLWRLGVLKKDLTQRRKDAKLGSEIILKHRWHRWAQISLR